MAGHSKWANIKFRKAGQDKKRSKVFTKLIREITMTAKQGGEDPDANPALRAAIDKALRLNMTRDTIERARKRASSAEAADLVRVCYEGYGPGGTAVLVEAMTDNRNRTVAEVRHAFSKCGGNLGTEGSVAYLFSKQGMIRFPKGSDEDAIMAVALEKGADDVVVNDDGSIEVQTAPESYLQVKDAMIAAGFEPEFADVSMVAETDVKLDATQAERMLKLLDMLEELDDVQEVYSNADIPDEIIANL